MMKKFYLLCATAMLLFSCAGNKEKDPEIADTDIAKETTIHCYMKVVNQDTFLLRLNKTGQKIAGNLEYDFFEKDRNVGMVAGELQGDTLFAEYKFKSEGVESVREVAFILHDVDVQEGYGEMEEKNGKMIFKDKSAVRFTDTTLFRNVPCPAQE
jgi:hypothetical protein